MAILKEYTFTCEHCGKTFTKMIDVADYEKDKNRKKKKYNYRFCSRSCANSRIMTKEKKEKISKSVKLYHNQCDRLVHIYEYTCEKCGKLFMHTNIRKGRHIHCDECKQ